MSQAPKSSPSFSAVRRWRIGFDVVLRTALVLAVLVMLNYLGGEFFQRVFLSSQARVELSPRTLSVLHSITNRINVTLYYDKTDEMFPTIAALLKEYQGANPKISVTTVDYVRDAGEAQKLKEHYKLSTQTDKDLVIFDCDGRVKIASGDALVKYTMEQLPNEKERTFRRKPVAFNGELLFTSSLLAVINPKPLKAYFLQGHGEPSLADKGDQGYFKFGAILAENYIVTEPLQLLGDRAVPDDCNLLIIAGPRTTLSEMELQKIGQYLDQGGRMFVLFNYFSVKAPTGLEDILARWGVNASPDVVQDLDHTTSTDGRDVIVYDFANHPAVNSLTGLALQLVLPRQVSRMNSDDAPDDAPKVDELMFSGPAATLASQPTAAPRRYPLMAAVEQKPATGMANTRGTTRIIVAGDSFFLGNQMVEAGANRDFLGYAANWLLDRTVLLDGIGPRPVTEFRLLMTREQQNKVRWLLLAALPGGVLVFGWLVWLVRRK
jgi:ABC-type uncharacterized transport system involved in gliding motility auxiliary subunit